MWRRTKLFLQFSFGILVSIAVILVGWSMLNEANFDINDAQKSSGRITGRSVGKDFSFKISGSQVSYSVYKPSRNYAELESELRVGDSITVYFVNSQTADIQVQQIEKNGRTVVSKELLAGQNRTGGVIAVIGGIAMTGATFWGFRKRKYKFWRSKNEV
ncbi:MAG: hypothetical protein JWR44_3363 [Hymenobacter sp.]|jgi:hypothetical protein|nr:hypothetical protein [Hymenobacter sp.]